MNEVNAIERASGLHAGERLMDAFRVAFAAAAPWWWAPPLRVERGAPPWYAFFVWAPPASPVNWSTISSEILCARRRDCGAGDSNLRDAIRRCSGVVRS